ncbi:MAG: hypothetical protein II837_05350 [Treponema sp.]|nr:hypothetical protein [Treponema sp.]
MGIFRKCTWLLFLTTYTGIFFLRVFHYGFIYRNPVNIITGCIPTISISFFLILACVLAERPILRRFERIIAKGLRDKNRLTEKDIADCWDCYKKFDVAIAIGDAVGFLLGAGSTAILEALKGQAPFILSVFIIIELQSVGVGFLCYTINVFLIKRIIMTCSMRDIGIKVGNNLSSNLKVAIATCVYISMMNMITVPVHLLMNPVPDGYSVFLRYCIIGGILTALVCFLTYNLIVRKIQSTEREVSNKLLVETMTLAKATKESAEYSQDQSAAVKEIVATMHDSTELAGSIGEKIKAVTSLAEKSRDAVLSGSEALRDSVNDLLDIRKTNTETIEGIKALNAKINGVWDIVGIINNVADQTKIIAFNAELEASSSGEAGKNFHIVATEIRRLSDNIIDSIKEIKIVIDEIQKASDTLILDSERGTRQIDAGCESARFLEGGFQSIMGSSKATADSSHEILEYVSQMTNSSEQIFVTLKQIAQGIEKFSENTASISASSEKVKDIAGLL